MKSLKTSVKENCIFEEYNLPQKKIPTHIAIIMDGNGRWAKKQGHQRTIGHKAGMEALRKTIQSCARLKISYLTVYAFSTENWARPEKEVSFLMTLFNSVLNSEVENLHKNNVKIKVLGNKNRLSDSLIKKIKKAEEKTKSNTRLQVNILIDYGSRQEIINACKRIATEFSKEEIEKLSESDFNQFLYTASIPEPEILIRPGKEYRISNFLLWQLSYSELIFIDTLWPEFNEESLINVIKEYQKRNRRFGSINDC